MHIPRSASALTAVALAAGSATFIPPANAATHQQSTGATSVSVASDRTNMTALTGQASSSQSVMLDYVVLRDNFYTYDTCESYRRNYVVTYPYHVDSYCTRYKQWNGRHWLYAAYDNCPDLADSTPRQTDAARV